MSQFHTFDLADWSPTLSERESRSLAAVIEDGRVLYLPQLRFDIRPEERRFLDPRWSDGKAKNIAWNPSTAQIKGAVGNDFDLLDLKNLVERFQQRAVALIEKLFPAYEPNLRVAQASLRPVPVAGRETSWRKDDSRLHVDAFPSRPNRGERILRVFANVNPSGLPRVWRVGEPFGDLVKRFLPRLSKPLPGSSALLNLLRITKSPRSDYDHFMLQLHDAMKADLGYQKTAPQETMPFPPGCVWICFSDQTSHAVMAGQHLFEQTLHLPVQGLYDPASSPLHILEAQMQRGLV